MKQLRIIISSFAILIFILVSGCSTSGGDGSEVAQGESSQSPVINPDEEFYAGAFVKELIPEGNPEWYKEVCLGGFGILGIRNFGKLMSARADGVNDPPYVRVMVISLGSKKLAFIVLDAAVIGNRVVKDIVAGVSAKTDIPQWQIYVAVTHSHSSPDLLGYMGGVSSEYRKFLIDASVNAVVNAHENMVPVRLMISETQYEPSVIVKDGLEVWKNNRPLKWVYNRRGWTSLSPEEAEGIIKPNYSNPDVDSTINVIEAVDLISGKTKCVFINYACHPVLITDSSRKISRDFCGYLVDYIQKKKGAPAIFLQGTLGDVNPGDWEDFGADDSNCYDFARQFGEDIAKQVLASMSDQMQISSEIYTKRAEVSVEIDNPLLRLLLAVQKSMIDMEFTAENEAKTYVNYIRFGKELQIATYPGEAVTHMGLGINENQLIGKDAKEIKPIEGPKQIMKAPFKIVTSQTNDTLMYLVPSVEWENAPDPMAGILPGTTYEEQMSMSLNGVFADNLRTAINRLIKNDSVMR